MHDNDANDDPYPKWMATQCVPPYVVRCSLFTRCAHVHRTGISIFFLSVSHWQKRISWIFPFTRNRSCCFAGSYINFRYTESEAFCTFSRGIWRSSYFAPKKYFYPSKYLRMYSGTRMLWNSILRPGILDIPNDSGIIMGGRKCPCWEKGFKYTFEFIFNIMLKVTWTHS